MYDSGGGSKLHDNVTKLNDKKLLTKFKWEFQWFPCKLTHVN